MTSAVLRIRDLTLALEPDRPILNRVSLDLFPDEIVGITGPSGAGKTSLARVMIGWYSHFQGQIVFKGNPLEPKDPQIQLLWQSYQSHLNPYFTVRELIEEPLMAFSGTSSMQRRQKMAHLAAQVGLDASLLHRRPGQLSGGQCRRVSLARVLAAQPALLICDEPFAGLDLSSQIQIMELLGQVQENRRIALVIISHEHLPLVPICNRILSLDQGRLTETPTMSFR